MSMHTVVWQRLRQSRDWSVTIDELEKELGEQGTKSEQSDALFLLGQVTEDVVPERERALGLYQRAWKLFPDNLKALSRAREIYSELGRCEMVAKLGEMELKSPLARLDLPAIVGEAMLDSGLKDKAKPTLEKALERTPNNVRVKDALAALSYDSEFWSDEVERLEDESARFDVTTSVRMLLRAARIQRLEAPDDPRLEAILRKALAKDIDEPSVNAIFEAALSGQQRMDDLFAHHIARANAQSDLTGKANAYRRFALEWIQRWKDKERGAQLFQLALDAVSSNGEAHVRSVVAAFSLLRQVHGARSEWSAVLDRADAILSRLGDDDRLFVATSAGMVAWRDLGDSERAKRYFRVAHQIAPDNALVRDFVAAVSGGDSFASGSQTQVRTAAETDAPAIVESKPPMDDDEADAASAAEAAAAAQKEAAAQREAQAQQEAAAREAAAQREAQAQQEAAAREAAAQKEAAAQREAQAQQEAAAREAAAREAAAQKEAAAQREEAAQKEAASQREAEAAKAKAAEAAKEPPKARQGRGTTPPNRIGDVPADLTEAMAAAQALESAPDKGVAAWKEVIAKHNTHRAPRRELARVLRAAGSWPQLADALRDEDAKACSDPADKAQVQRELADVYAKLNNDSQMMAALSASLAADPTQLDLYEQLANLYEAKKRWPDLVRLLGEKAERVDSVHEKTEINLRIASLYLGISNQAEAIKAFEKVLELDPQNGQAIEHLLSVYEKRRDWEKLIKLKEAEVERAPGHEQAARIIEVARMAQTKVKKPEICMYWWEKVISVEPTHEEALTELYKLYERGKDWAKLAEVSSRQAEIASDDKTRIEALQRLGLLYMEKVEDSAKAIEAWQRLIALDENNRRAQDALKKLYVTEGRWDDLEEFYRSRNKLDEYLRVLEREVEAGSEAQRLPLAMKIAVLYRDEVGKPDRAMRAFEKVLTLDPAHLGAAEALIPLYEAGRDPKKLVGVLEIQLAATEDGAMRQERIKKIAEFSEEKLRDKPAAFGWWLRAHQEDHRPEWIRAELERLAQEIQRWPAVVDAYGASLRKFEAESEQSDALPLMLVMARVLEKELGDVDRALAMNRQVLSVDDGNPQALDALERLYLSKGQYAELLGVYSKKLDLTSDPTERLAIQSRIGQLYEVELKDDASAIAAYQAMLDAAGDEPSALGALDRIYLRNEKWAELADVIGRQLTAISPDDDRKSYLELKYRLGQVRERNLSDVLGAIDAYRDILDLEPKHGGATAALESRLTDPAHQLRVAAILEPIYEQVGEAAKLVGVHEIQLAAETDTLRRVELLLKIGALHRGQLGDADKAFDANARCFQEDPQTEAAKNELEQLAHAVDGGWERLIKLYEAALAPSSGDSSALAPTLAHELATTVAQSYETRLGRSDKAVEFYRKALAIEPSDLEALAALEAIFTREDRHSDLLDVYRRRAEITDDPARRLDVMVKIAAIQEEMLGQPDQAIAAYSDILSHDADNVAALRALDRLYLQRGRWQDLSENLIRQLALVDEDGERVRLLVRLAQLREAHLGDPVGAIDTYRQVIDLDGGPAMLGPGGHEAVRALEKMLGAALTNPGTPSHAGEQELPLATILEPIYRAGGDWKKQVGVYEVMVRSSFDPVQKIELLHRIADLYEVGGDDLNAAFGTQSRALREDPRSDITHAQLERLTRGLSRWRDLIGLYDQIVGDSHDDELKVALLFRIAALYAGELRDDTSAVATYERVLAVMPENIQAITAIQEVHERSGNWPALVDALRRRSALLLEVPERKALLYRAAQIEEEGLGNADAAIATYRAVLAVDESDDVAMDALERMFVRLGRWDALKDIYAKKADLAEDVGEKKRMLFVLAQVYDRELSDTGKAIETYQGILDLDADEVPAVQSLDRLYGKAERWYDLLANLERQVELAESTTETVALKYRIGDLWQNHLGDVARAIDSYREALEVDPSHPETVRALDSLVRGKNEPLLAARVLEPIYEGTGEHGKLIEVLEVIVANTEDPLARVELYHRIGQLAEFRLGDGKVAFDAYVRALRDDSGNAQTLGHVERLAEACGTWPAVAELYSSEADKTMDVPRQVDLMSRLARVYEQELSDLERAMATYRRIIDAEFDNRPAVLALDRLYTQTQRHSDLAEILRREIQLAEAEGEIRDLQYRLGQTLEVSIGDRKAAIEVYREILAATPNHAPTVAALETMFFGGHHQVEIGQVIEPLYEAAGEFERLHQIGEVQLAKLTGAERQGMMQRLAELAENKLYDQGLAYQWWSQGLVEDPRWEQAIEETERLARATAAWDDQVVTYTRALDRATDGDVRRQTLLRLARVYEFELGDGPRAIETHLRALELEPKDPDALAALDRLYVGAGMYRELVDVLRRRIDITLDGDEQLELQFRRGAVYSESLGELDAALACYQAILDQESRNRRALECQEAIFFRREEWAKLFETYEKLIDVAEGDAELADVYARMARLAAEALNQDDKAIDLLGRVLDIRGEEPAALAALGDIHERNQRWQEWIEVMERQVGVSTETSEQIALYKQMGRTWADKLGRERNALDAWLAADRLDERDLETLRALAHLYRSTQGWEELSQTVRRIIDVGAVTGQIGEDETIELYAQLGQLEGEILGRVDDAVEAWRRVVALDPSDFRALGALENLFTREARWEEAIEVMEKRALVLDDAGQRIDTLLQAAATWEEKVDNLTAAAAVYARVRGVDPSNAVASERLEHIYRAQYKWEQLAEILLERYEHRPDINLLVQVAKIYETELDNQDAAFSILQEAFKSDFTHEETAQELSRLATATNRWSELLQEYSNQVQELERVDRVKAADLWVKIGRWYGEHLSQIDWAIHSVQQALRIDPSHLGGLAALAELQRRRGSWHELAEVLHRQAAAEVDTTRKTAAYLALAELLEIQLNDASGAIHNFQSALATDPASKEALVALDRLYRRGEMWAPLIDVLARRAELEHEERDILRLRLEIGQIWDQRLYDAGQAITAYRAVVDVDPGNMVALRALEQLYERTGQSERYLEVLEAQLDASPSDAERVSLYERMAAAWEERFGKLDRAAEAFEKIVALDPRNYGAYRELARLYQAAGKWEALVETYRSHIMATTDVATRIDLYCAMGQIYEQQLHDLDRAIESYTDVLSFDTDEPRALDALGRLYERISEWDRAIEATSALVRQTHDPRKQVDLYWRMGRIQADQLHDPEAAEANFLRGLAIDNGHVPTMESLVKLYADRGDWLKAAQMMVRAEGYTPVVIDKVRLLYDAARIYQDRLRHNDQAKQLYAAVIALDPEHVEAGRPLAELYFEAQQWAPLAPVAEMLVRKLSGSHADPRELNDLYFRAARAFDELGDFSRSLAYYKAAYDLDATYLPTLVGRADLLFKMQDWDGAGRIYQTILVQHRDSLPEAEVVRLYYRLGMVRQNLGERKKALNMFEKALEIEPAHRETLLAVIDLQQQGGDFEAVVLAKRGLAATAGAQDKIRLLDEIGGIYHERLQNPQKAIAAYSEALDLVPDDHQLLQKVMNLYEETRQWKKVVEVIERFIGLERDPIVRGKYYHAAATITRDELKGLDEAVDYYGRALDSYFADPDRMSVQLMPGALKSFEAIDRILTTKRDWKAQERAYREMIKRVKDGDAEVFGKVRVGLFDALGEIYRSRLKHYQSAIGAFEVAQSLDPASIDRSEKLAELYLVAGPDYVDKAVDQHMRMLHIEPFKYDSYKALGRIYMDAHQYDKRWCVCNTLAFLKKADPDEVQFYEQYKPRGLVKAKNVMGPDVWAKLIHPEENRYISAVFSAVWQGVAAMKGYSHKELGIKRKDKRQLMGDQLMFSKLFVYAAQIMNVPLPEVFLVEDGKNVDMQLANFMEKSELIPSFVVRPQLLQGRTEREIAFLSARRLTFVRPEYYLKMLLPTNTELKVAFLAAIAMVQPRFPMPPDAAPLVAQYIPEVQKRTPPHALEQLAVVVNRFLQAQPEVNLAKWGFAADAVAQRAGFVLCGDLEVAARMVSAEPVTVGGPQVKDRIKELVLYSISEEYFAVRAALGLTIG